MTGGTAGLLVTKRNYGLFSMNRLEAEGREYEFSFSIDGPDSSVGAGFSLDLDAATILPRPLLGVRSIARRCLRASGALSVRDTILATPGAPQGGSLRAALRFILRSRCN
jgi:hypothetical protein